MTVELITAATPEIHEAMGRLIPQLSRSAAPMSEADVERFLAQSGVHLFVFRPDTTDAEGNHPILGMLSLATFEIPTGVRAWVEDVVVDEAARGQGAGQRCACTACGRSVVCSAYFPSILCVAARPRMTRGRALHLGFEGAARLGRAAAPESAQRYKCRHSCSKNGSFRQKSVRMTTIATTGAKKFAQRDPSTGISAKKLAQHGPSTDTSAKKFAQRA